MKTLSVGMVGYGFMGRIHTYAYKSLSMLYEPAPAKIKLVGVAVRSEDSQRLALEQGEYLYATKSYCDLINDPEIDIIDVCTPNNTHRDIAVEAIRAGKHVYVDKPLAATLAQAEDVVKAEQEMEAKGVQRTRQMTQNYRFVPALMRAKELLDDGRLGAIYSFNIRYLHSSLSDPNRPIAWRTDKEIAGGGVLVDLGEHIIDLTRHLLGGFRRVCAFPVTQIHERPDGLGGMRKIDTDDVTFITAELVNGAVGTLEASKIATGSNDEISVEIRGSKGSILFNLMEPNWLKFYDNTLPDSPLGGDKGFTWIESVQRYPSPATLPGPKVTVGWPRFHAASIYEFVRRVVAGEPGCPSLSDGLAAQRVIDACYRSQGTWTEIGTG